MLRLLPASGPRKTDVPMAPMIDIVFQLLIFFMLNLKIVAPEGNFDLNMPTGICDDCFHPGTLLETRVRLVADTEGNLDQIYLGDNALGNDDRAFDRLNGEILKLVGRPGNPLSQEMEITIDADYGLRYEYVVKALSRCTGRLDEQGHVIRYVEKIRFAAPKKPNV